MQRESLTLPALAQRFTMAGNMAVNGMVTRFMMEGQNTDIPIAFMNVQQVRNAIQEGIGYAVKMSDSDEVWNSIGLTDSLQLIQHESVKNMSDLSQVMGLYVLETLHDVKAVMVVFANANVCTVTGSAGSYYLFDVTRGMFLHTSSPEFDILDYHLQYGDQGSFTAYMWSLKGRESAAIEVSESEEPTQKKNKTEPVEVVAEEEEVIKAKPKTVKRRKKTEEKTEQVDA